MLRRLLRRKRWRHALRIAAISFWIAGAAVDWQMPWAQLDRGAGMVKDWIGRIPAPALAWPWPSSPPPQAAKVADYSLLCIRPGLKKLDWDRSKDARGWWYSAAVVKELEVIADNRAFYAAVNLTLVVARPHDSRERAKAGRFVEVYGSAPGAARQCQAGFVAFEVPYGLPLVIRKRAA